MSTVSRRALGFVVIGGVTYWVSVVVAMHFLEPEFSPLTVTMSAYVLGVYGRWMTTTFFVLGAALLCLRHGLAKTLPDTRVVRVGSSFLLVAAAGIILSGLFPTDPIPAGATVPSRNPTTSGALHNLGAVAFPALALGPLLLSLRFRDALRWRSVSVAAVVLSASLTVAFALGFALGFAGLAFGFAGLAQRLFFAALLPWMTLVGLGLIRFAAEDP